MCVLLDTQSGNIRSQHTVHPFQGQERAMYVETDWEGYRIFTRQGKQIALLGGSGNYPADRPITISPDGRTLYVDNTIGTTVYRYDIQPDGTVKNKRAFAELHDIKAGEEGFGDGMGMDRDGRLYVTTLTGIQVFDPQGKYLGTIKVPRQPSNVAFAGPDKKTLYIVGGGAVYKVAMIAEGVKSRAK